MQLESIAALLRSCGAALHDRIGANHLLIINSLRPHPATIGKRRKETGHQHDPPPQVRPVFHTVVDEKSTEESDYTQQAFQNGYIGDLKMAQILKTIDDGEKREGNGQQGPPQSPFPRERVAVSRRDSAK